MDKTEWRVYRIEDKGDLMSALKLYELRRGTRARYARMSERAPEWLAALVQEVDGLEIERAANLLPLDLWLTHERQERKVEAQMRLFEEARK
ncbi:hypothetical protein ATHL_00043 [Anaerolinea thermolimosa]|uniref:hypothetical protein n=1 Tax=Anaerolinea thermolimosa TaxID=229919 RepID=UPI0013B3A3DA|nr:hypothetical protein [Anaerolinea thermolimosa]GAP05214.1 hypothetical protein ATHL_00043 [Anaerolinea thermolimosa]